MFVDTREMPMYSITSGAVPVLHSVMSSAFGVICWCGCEDCASRLNACNQIKKDQKRNLAAVRKHENMLKQCGTTFEIAQRQKLSQSGKLSTGLVNPLVQQVQLAMTSSPLH